MPKKDKEFNHKRINDDMIKCKKITDEENKRVNSELKNMEDMKEARSSQLDRWDDLIRRQQFEKDKETVNKAEKNGRSYLRIPFEFAHVESKTADEVDTLPFPVVLPGEKSDIKMAERFQKGFDFVVNKTLNLRETLIRLFIKQKNTLGDGIVKIYWKKEERTINVPVGKIEKGVVKTEPKKITVYDDIKVDVVDLRNFLIDPIVFKPDKTLEDANYCGFFSEYDIDTFKELFGKNNAYKNVELVQASSGEQNDITPSSKESKADVKRGDNTVEVYESWNILKDQMITIANGIEIRFTPCPYSDPFSKMKTLPISHFIGHMSATGFYNFSEIDLTADLADEREGMRNINLDAAKGYTHPWIVLGGMAELDADDFVAGINPVLDLNGGSVSEIKELRLGGNTTLPFNLEGANANDAVIATGHDVSGIISGQGETATRTLERRESGVKRTKFTNEYNELAAYRRMYYLIKNLMIQFYDKDRLGKMIGDDGIKLFEDIEESVKLLGSDYNIDIKTNNTIPATKEIQKLRNQEAVGILSNVPRGENGAIPSDMINAVEVLLRDMNIDEEGIDKALVLSKQAVSGVSGGGEEGGEGLQDVVKQAEELGLTTPTKGSDKAGSALKSQSEGVQQNAQSIIQNLTPAR